MNLCLFLLSYRKIFYLTLTSLLKNNILHVVFLISMLANSQVNANEINENCVTHSLADSSVPVEAGTINQIHICTEDVFDENNNKENGILYRVANFLHIKTKHKYIAEQLLISPGDTVDPRILNETERNIRSNNYISSASVTTQPNETNPDSTDIIVTTRDAWTTKPTFSFGHSGGASTSSIGLREDNLFGEGIRFSIKQKNDIERNSTEFKYSDDTFLGSDKAFHGEYANNTDGYIKGFSISKPYKSLNDRLSYGLSYKNEILDNRYYVLGEESLSFTNFSKTSDIYFSFSNGFSDGKTIRHRFGIKNETYNLSDIEVEIDNPSSLSVLNIVNQTTHAPYYEFNLIEDQFKKARNIRAIGRSEDRNYGYELRTRFGISDAAFEAEENTMFYELELSKIFQLVADADLSIHAQTLFFIDSENPNQSRSSIDLEYFKNQTDNIKFFSSLTLEAGRQLRNGQQITLDNLTGLRGYPLNYLSGDTSSLFTIEERIYFDKVIWNIINVGAAAFIDVGNVTGEPALDALDTPYFRSVGVGLRLGSNRSSNSGILHIDFAKPLDIYSGSRSFQFAIELKEKF